MLITCHIRNYTKTAAKTFTVSVTSFSFTPLCIYKPHHKSDNLISKARLLTALLHTSAHSVRPGYLLLC